VCLIPSSATSIPNQDTGCPQMSAVAAREALAIGKAVHRWRLIEQLWAQRAWTKPPKGVGSCLSYLRRACARAFVFQVED
jgi:hypothetical protein